FDSVWSGKVLGVQKDLAQGDGFAFKHFADESSAGNIWEAQDNQAFVPGTHRIKRGFPCN
ncbi:hypothetical protein STEG23_033461, partial [Scotinomys teguina]